MTERFSDKRGRERSPTSDGSSGYEAVADAFLAGRGRWSPTAIGVTQVRAWARTFPDRATVIDLGCGPGLPITKVLIDEGLHVYAIDASPSLLAAFHHNFPDVPVACESVQESSFFARTFDGVLAWGLMFLLRPAEQRRLIRRFAAMLVRGGRLLFTSTSDPAAWNDAMTGSESESLGATEYRRLLSASGFSVVAEYEDEGRNHYFDAVKR